LIVDLVGNGDGLARRATRGGGGMEEGEKEKKGEGGGRKTNKNKDG